MLYRTIWIENRENRKLVFDDKINVVVCAKCKLRTKLEFSLLCTNVKEHIAVWYEPHPDPDVDKDMKDYAQHFGASSFYATAPRIRDWKAFKEKIVELEQRTGMKPAAKLSPEMQSKMRGFLDHLKEQQAQKKQAGVNALLAWWRSRTKLFRAWAFFSLMWAVLVFLCVLWFDPFDYGSWSYINDEEFFHMLTLMVVPPALIGAGKWAWDNWVA